MPIRDHYSPDVFAVAPLYGLTKQDFEAHPIWAHYYYRQEDDELLEWGIDAERLTTELESARKTHPDCGDWAYTLLRPYPLPFRNELFIRATITFADGQEIDGFVITNEYAEVYSVSVFANGDRFHVMGICDKPSPIGSIEEQLSRLTAGLGRSADGIFPVHYKTDFLNQNDELFEGVIPPPEKSS